MIPQLDGMEVETCLSSWVARSYVYTVAKCRATHTL